MSAVWFASVATLLLVVINPATAYAPYSIGLWGDLPYSAVQETEGVPNIIADMNSQKLAFTVHDGDLKAGSKSPCDDAMYVRAYKRFNSLKAPAMFTPGDNDWVDCDRDSNKAPPPNVDRYYSLERLDFERSLFFSTPRSMGQRSIKQEVQTEALCLNFARTLVPCVENRRWTIQGVVYATLNVQGSCNNLCDDFPDAEEFAARNAANIKWMQETFAKAKSIKAAAVMLISQANPGWDLTDATRAPTRDPLTLVQVGTDPDGFKDYLLALRSEVIAFGLPVAYVCGDSHYFRIDKPFLDSSGKRLETFTRVETFGNNAANGNNDVQWLKVNVDAKTRDVFAYQPQIVNRVAVPLPAP